MCASRPLAGRPHQHHLLQIQIWSQLLDELPARSVRVSHISTSQSAGGRHRPLKRQLLEDIFPESSGRRRLLMMIRVMTIRRPPSLRPVILVVVDAPQISSTVSPSAISALGRLLWPSGPPPPPQQRRLQQPARRLRVAVVQMQPAGLSTPGSCYLRPARVMPLAVQGQAINHVTGHPIHLAPFSRMVVGPSYTKGRTISPSGSHPAPADTNGTAPFQRYGKPCHAHLGRMLMPAPSQLAKGSSTAPPTAPGDHA